MSGWSSEVRPLPFCRKIAGSNTSRILHAQLLLIGNNILLGLAYFLLTCLPADNERNILYSQSSDSSHMFADLYYQGMGARHCTVIKTTHNKPINRNQRACDEVGEGEGGEAALEHFLKYLSY